MEQSVFNVDHNCMYRRGLQRSLYSDVEAVLSEKHGKRPIITIIDMPNIKIRKP